MKVEDFDQPQCIVIPRVCTTSKTRRYRPRMQETRMSASRLASIPPLCVSQPNIGMVIHSLDGRPSSMEEVGLKYDQGA